MAASLVLGGCFGAAVVPPSRTDVGSVVVADRGEMAGGLRLSTGAHLASGLMRRDLPIDVGVGYVYERLAPARGSGRDAGDGAAPGATVPPIEAHGGYVEVAHTLRRTHWHRSWLALRGEALARESAGSRRSVAAGYARLSWELLAPAEGSGVDSTACGAYAGFSYGMLGLGLFVESGARWTEEEGTAFAATAGLSVRLPLLGGFGFDLCPCF